MNAAAGEMVVQWLGCLPCKCEDQVLDHQNPLKCWVSVVSHLQFWSQKVETEDSQSKLVSKTSHIYKPCVRLGECASRNKVQEQWRTGSDVNHLRIQNPEHKCTSPHTNTHTHIHAEMETITTDAFYQSRLLPGLSKQEDAEGSLRP